MPFPHSFQEMNSPVGEAGKIDAEPVVVAVVASSLAGSQEYHNPCARVAQTLVDTFAVDKFLETKPTWALDLHQLKE